MTRGMKAGLLCLVLLGLIAQLPLTTSRTAYAAQQPYGATTGNGSDAAPLTVYPMNATAHIETNWGKMPLYFISNQGQLDSRVAFYVQGADKTLYFAEDGVTFALNAPASDSSPASTGEQLRSRWTVKLDFVAANRVRPVGDAQTDAVISYFRGTPDQWHTGLPTYSQIVYPDLWDGIDLVYSGTVDRLKYEFVIKPGADPSQIQVAYRGATVSANELGQLEISTPGGGFQDDVPTAYQQVDGVREPVDVEFAPNDDAARASTGQSEMDGLHSYGFQLGRYDATVPLVIDPAVLVYAGYIGAGSGNGIAVDTAGNAYVTGDASSTQATFPVLVGPDLTSNGGHDPFAAKVSAYRPLFAAASKSVDKTTVFLGDSLSYTIAFTMTFGISPTNVLVTDTLPSALSYIPASLSASSGSYGYSGGAITWNGTVDANIPVTVTFGVTVSSPALSIVNTAVVDGGEQATPSATVQVQGSSICNLVKNPSNPVLGVGAGGAWDSVWVWEPTVLKEGSTYKMWYTGRDASNNWKIGYATSADGITWTKYAGNPVLSPSLSWEGTRVAYPTVVNDNGTYKMWYSGQDNSGVGRIGYATSPDGITWTKYAGNPVLNVGASGAWDGASVRYPSVIKLGGTFHLWYGGNDGASSRIGHATSSDGIGWAKDAANPVLGNGNPGSWDWTTLYAPNVILHNGLLLMWYSGETLPAASQTGYATSLDGRIWTRRAKLIAEGTAGAFDSDSADYASVIEDGAGLKIWYSGYNSLGTYTIGSATAQVCTSTPPSPGPGSTFLPLITKSQTVSCSAYYADNFSNPNSGWPIGSDSIGQVTYVGGEYQVRLSPYYWTAQTPGASGTDYAVTARARRMSGSGDYGIVFGITPGWSRFYALLIDPPWYAIRSYNNGTWAALAPWSTSPYVMSGSNALKVIRNGTSISAYANGQLLATVNDGTITGWTRVGLIVRSGGSLQDVRFDDFAMYPASCGAGALAPSAAFRMDTPENREGAVPPSEFKR